MSASLMDQMGALMHAVDDTAHVAAASPQVSLPELAIIVGRLAALTGRICDVAAEVARQAEGLPEFKILETSAEPDGYQSLGLARHHLQECGDAADAAHEHATPAYDQVTEIRIVVDLDTAPHHRRS